MKVVDMNEARELTKDEAEAINGGNPAAVGAFLLGAVAGRAVDAFLDDIGTNTYDQMKNHLKSAKGSKAK